MILVCFIEGFRCHQSFVSPKVVRSTGKRWLAVFGHTEWSVVVWGRLRAEIVSQDCSEDPPDFVSLRIGERLRLRFLKASRALEPGQGLLCVDAGQWQTPDPQGAAGVPSSKNCTWSFLWKRHVARMAELFECAIGRSCFVHVRFKKY